MIRSSSKGSLQSITTSSSDEQGASVFERWWNETEELFYNLSNKIPAHNLIGLVSLLIECISTVVISMDPFYSWGERTKDVLTGFSWIRGPVPSSWNYAPDFVILFAVAVIIILAPLCFALYIMNSGNPANWTFSALNLLNVLVYKWFYYILMTILLIPLKCNFATQTLVYFPQEQCWESPNIIIFSIAIVPIILMVILKSIILLFILEKFHQLDSICATANGRFLFVAHLFQTIILILTDVFQVQGYRIAIPILALIMITILLVLLIRYMYFHRFWTNVIYGTSLAMSFGGFFSCIVAEATAGQEISSFAFLSMIPFVVLFFIVVCVRHLLFKSYVLSQIDKADEAGSVKEAFTWFTPLDFEAAAHTFSDKEMQQKLYSLGYDKHKTSLKMKVAYALYLLVRSPECRHTLHILLKPHNSRSLWEADTRFFYTYCKTKNRESEMTHGKGDKLIIKQLAKAKKCFDKIKALIKQIWETFMEENVDFSKLPGIISTIQAQEDKYEKIIEDILKIDPNHVGTLRAYGVFEAEIRKNVYKAEALFAEADMAEDKKVQKSMRKSKKFSHYMNQVVSTLLKKTKVKSEPYKVTDSPFIVDKTAQTPQATTVDLEDAHSVSEKELKSVYLHKDSDSQSTSSHESHSLTFVKQSTGRNIDDIIQMEKLRLAIDNTSVLSTTVLKIVLILIVFVGIGLLIGAFINSNSMLQRFTVAGDVINMAVGARSDIVNALNQLRGMQICFSPRAKLSQAELGNITNFRTKAQHYCNALRDKCYVLYDRATFGDESWVWRDPDGVQMIQFFDDGSTAQKNFSLFDSCLTFDRFCEKVIAYPDKRFSSGEILKDVDYKNIIINGANSILPKLQVVVDALFKTEKSFKESFILGAIIIPMASFLILLAVFPINMWIFYDLKKSFKMLKLVKKSIIANILKDIEKKKIQSEEQEFRAHVNRPTIKQFTMNITIITIILAIMVGVVSMLGGIASIRFEDQIHEVDAACFIQQTVNRINYLSTELVFGVYSYFDNNTLIELITEEMATLRIYDDAIRSGNAALDIKPADQSPEFREFYYSKNCEDVTKYECFTFQQQISLYMEEVHHLLTNYSIDSVHFANLKYLVDNVLTSKLDTQVRMFKRRSDATTKPVQVTLFVWIVFAVFAFIIIFIYLFWSIGGLLEKEILRAKSLLLFLPADVITKNVALLNFLTNKSIQVENTLHTSRIIREGTYSRILQTTSDAVIEFSSNRKIDFANPEAEEMFQCSSKDLIGTAFEKLFTPESTGDLLNWISRNVTKKKAFESEMIAISKGSGDEQSTFPVRVVIAFSEKRDNFGLLERATTYVAFIRNIMAEQKQKELLMEEKKRSYDLICNILPKSIASQKMDSGDTKDKDKIIVSSHPEVTMLFADIVGFTALTSKISPEEVITMLNELFSAFDDLAHHYKVEKIKTIGDCYFVASGVPEYRIEHAESIMEFAIDMLEIVNLYNKKTGRDLQLRIGINSGPVVAGVIGKQKFCYDLWGDAVNVASRMESTGLAGKIQVSRETYKYLYSKYKFTERELQNVKGKGEMLAYIYEGRKVPRKHHVVDIAKLLNYSEEDIFIKEESKDALQIEEELAMADSKIYSETAQDSEPKDAN